MREKIRELFVIIVVAFEFFRLFLLKLVVLSFAFVGFVWLWTADLFLFFKVSVTIVAVLAFMVYADHCVEQEYTAKRRES